MLVVQLVNTTFDTRNLVRSDLVRRFGIDNNDICLNWIKPQEPGPMHAFVYGLTEIPKDKLQTVTEICSQILSVEPRPLANLAPEEGTLVTTYCDYSTGHETQMIIGSYVQLLRHEAFVKLLNGSDMSYAEIWPGNDEDWWDDIINRIVEIETKLGIRFFLPDAQLIPHKCN